MGLTEQLMAATAEELLALQGPLWAADGVCFTPAEQGLGQPPNLIGRITSVGFSAAFASFRPSPVARKHSLDLTYCTHFGLLPHILWGEQPLTLFHCGRSRRASDDPQVPNAVWEL